MKKDLWPEVKPILDRALDLSGKARRELVERECAGRPDLRSELDEYLELEDEVYESFREPLLDLVAGRPAEYRGGQRIGPYRLEQEIARGGMGVVYGARRVEGGFDQQVAIKVLRKGFDTGDFVRWFRAERQILSDLDHPNIARLLDGGTTPDGLPYLVMEAVEGRRLDLYCEAEELSVDECLEIFREICDAVHAAHQRLVVHCDLKPSNILVTCEGKPKVLDFGIAKVLHQNPEGVTRSLALRLGSPRYASPEQGVGGTISTATDVYSLGCILFLLLTGRPPRPRQDQEALPEIPSRCAGRASRESLRGDLDAIVLKAMAWEPEARYASAAALADDVECHRARRPVSAQPPTWHYLLGRFLRRNRSKVFAAAIFLLVASAAIVTSIAFHWQARLEASRAVGMRDAYLEMLEVYDPNRDESQAEAARSAVQTILTGEHLRDDRDRSVIYDRMGRLFYRLEFLTEAKQLLERALALRREGAETDPEDLAASLNNLALVEKKLGQLDRAAALFEEALTHHHLHPTGTEAERLDLLSNLAEIDRERGRIEKAEAGYRETLRRREALHGPRSMEVARSLNNLGKLLVLDGRFDEAEPFLWRSLELRQELLGPDHPSVGTATANLAALLDARGDHDEAVEAYRRVLQIRLREAGEVHPKTARAQSALGYALLGRCAEGDLSDALKLLRRALGTYRDTYGLEHEITRIIQRNLAAAILAEGDAAGAQALLQEILEQSDDWREEESWRLADIRSLLGFSLAMQGQVERARSFLDEAWVPIEEQRGAESRPAREARERWAEWRGTIEKTGG